MNKSILLIDDEPLIIVPLFYFLSKKGYDVVSTNSPLAALTLIQPHKFDIIITDLKMNPIGGAEIVRQLQDSSFSGKIIIISAQRIMDLDAEDALKVDAYFEKPFDLSSLHNKIMELSR